MTTPKSPSIFYIETVDKFTVFYGRSERIILGIWFAISIALVSVADSFLYISQPTPFSSNWFAIPLCAFANASILVFLYRSGMLKSPLQINQDGIVRQGIWNWRFPGPMRAVSTKVFTRNPRFVLELRYGSVDIPFPGDATEGYTIGIAAKLNRWIASKMQTRSVSSDVKKKSKIDWLLCICTVSAITMVMTEAIWNQSGYYLDDRASYGMWSRVAVILFSVLTLGVFGAKLWKMAVGEIGVNFAVWITEIAVALLMIFGSCAMVARGVQLLELSIAPGHEMRLDEPLVLQTRTGKGCHRFLILQNLGRKEPVSYCDQKNIQYWDGVSRVRVRFSRSQLGMHIESIERIPGDSF